MKRTYTPERDDSAGFSVYCGQPRTNVRRNTGAHRVGLAAGLEIVVESLLKFATCVPHQIGHGEACKRTENQCRTAEEQSGEECFAQPVASRVRDFRRPPANGQERKTDSDPDNRASANRRRQELADGVGVATVVPAGQRTTDQPEDVEQG